MVVRDNLYEIMLEVNIIKQLLPHLRVSVRRVNNKWRMRIT